MPKQENLEIQHELGMRLYMEDEFVGIGLTESEEGLHLFVTDLDAQWIKDLGGSYKGFQLSFEKTGKVRTLPAEV